VVDGVVRGIGGYGNCVGVPTVGGEVNFHAAYDGNPLVNAMTVGIARTDKIFLSAAAGHRQPGGLCRLQDRARRHPRRHHGQRRVRRGSEEKRPTVQVGDPFTEKLLIEACLELMATDAIVAIQDMGAAGLTSPPRSRWPARAASASSSTSTQVPQRETGMTAYEMMLSESQERMLMVLRPDREDMARAIFEKWELDFAVIGHLTDTGRIVVRHHGAWKPTSRSPRWPTRRRCITAPTPSRPNRAPLGRRRPRRPGRRAAEADRLPRPVLARLDLGPVRQHRRRPDR
jgi:phosphoribosylformylglycinamidine (FGAM) synthase-like enzyme